MIETPSLLVILTRVVMLMLGLGFSTDPGTVAQAQLSGCAQFSPGNQLPALINPRLEERTTLLCNDAYAVLASGVTHGALWSAEHPTAASVAAARDTVRESEFFPEPRLPPADRAQLEDYRRSDASGHRTSRGFSHWLGHVSAVSEQHLQLLSVLETDDVVWEGGKAEFLTGTAGLSAGAASGWTPLTIDSDQ